MEPNDRTNFEQAMGVLRSTYNDNRSPARADEQNKAFWLVLSKYPMQIVAKAIMSYPSLTDRPHKYMPNAPELAAYCKALEKTDCAIKPHKEVPTGQDRRSKREAYGHLPRTQQGMSEYIDEAANPFERLARLWECDSASRDLDPNAPTPPDISKTRLAQFWEVWRLAERARDALESP